jgi:5-aminolevulinate synthase
MDYQRIFAQAIDRLHAEGRYRVFIDILRNKGSYPNARCFAGHNGPKPSPSGAPTIISPWASTPRWSRRWRSAARCRRRLRRHPQHRRQHPLSYRARGRACRPARQGSGLLFTSGYISNEATLSTLGRLLPGCIIFSDELNHASMIAGIRNSGCEKRVFRHNDLDHLEELLASAPADAPKLIAFESVYSMDGDVAPIAAMCDLADRYNALTYLGRGPRRRHVRRARRRHFERDEVASRLTIIEARWARPSA